MTNYFRTARWIGFGLAVGAACVVASVPAQGVHYHAPSLVGQEWLNVKQGDLDRVLEFKGRVTLLHFWTFECINCKHNLPSYAAWAKKFPSDSVQVIGVHTPELPEERNLANVKRALPRLGIEYPVLVDSKETNWTRYGVQVWPTVFVIDKKGRVRYTWVGELGYNGANGFQQLTRSIQELLKEPG